MTFKFWRWFKRKPMDPAVKEAAFESLVRVFAQECCNFLIARVAFELSPDECKVHDIYIVHAIDVTGARVILQIRDALIEFDITEEYIALFHCTLHKEHYLAHFLLKGMLRGLREKHQPEGVDHAVRDE